MKQMKTSVLALVALALSAGSAMAQKKQLVIVVKGLDNPVLRSDPPGLREME